jgi:putative hydrolase of HD superfamily
MKKIVNLLFEASFLKKIPRSGFQFLGMGHESVAEHSFTATFIGWVLAQLVPEADPARLLPMCLLHDLPEARTGDLNYVQKAYVAPAENKALADLADNLPMGSAIQDLLAEFNAAESLEARLAHDADQLAFLLELKLLADQGYRPPNKWIPHVRQRMRTEVGQELAATIVRLESDTWWLKNIIDRSAIKK